MAGQRTLQDEGQNGQDPLHGVSQCWGSSGERKGEKMLPPTLPRPGTGPRPAAVTPTSCSTHLRGNATDFSLWAHLAAFLLGNGSLTETELGSWSPKETSEFLGLAAEHFSSFKRIKRANRGGECTAAPADPQETLSCAMLQAGRQPLCSR